MIAIDPGVKACGVAWFDNGALSIARLVPVRDLRKIRQDTDLVIEMPRIYPGSDQRKGDLNDLLNLAAVVGFCEGLFLCDQKRYFPSIWKGQVPKMVMVERIKKTLSEAERACVVLAGAKSHNVWDAVGIGLFHLGRL